MSLVVVVATTAAGVADVRARLTALGVSGLRVASPGPARRLVLGDVDDDASAVALVSTLGAAGELAVARPAGGPRLAAWVEHTHPVTFASRLSACFAWSEHPRHGLPALLELGTGGWGSGQHPSTRLVVESLITRIDGGERVLDVGCGSGLLGLAALALGASHVTGVDIDPSAVEATARNAALNGYAEGVTATVAPLADVDGSFDVVVANLGRAAIVELAAELMARVAPDGWLAVGGIPPSLCSLVVGYLRPLVEVERRTSGDWAVVVLGRAGARG